LGTLQTAGELATVTLTGTKNSVTAAQAMSIAGLTTFSVGSGATLVVADAPANLLLVGNGAGLAKATPVLLTGGTIATAAQATLLAALRNAVRRKLRRTKQGGIATPARRAVSPPDSPRDGA
jgi:hypothetical protein